MPAARRVADSFVAAHRIRVAFDADRALRVVPHELRQSVDRRDRAGFQRGLARVEQHVAERQHQAAVRVARFELFELALERARALLCRLRLRELAPRRHVLWMSSSLRSPLGLRLGALCRFSLARARLGDDAVALRLAAFGLFARSRFRYELARDVRIALRDIRAMLDELQRFPILVCCIGGSERVAGRLELVGRDSPRERLARYVGDRLARLLDALDTSGRPLQPAAAIERSAIAAPLRIPGRITTLLCGSTGTGAAHDRVLRPINSGALVRRSSSSSVRKPAWTSDTNAGSPDSARWPSQGLHRGAASTASRRARSDVSVFDSVLGGGSFSRASVSLRAAKLSPAPAFSASAMLARARRSPPRKQRHRAIRRGRVIGASQQRRADQQQAEQQHDSLLVTIHLYSPSIGLSLPTRRCRFHASGARQGAASQCAARTPKKRVRIPEKSSRPKRFEASTRWRGTRFAYVRTEIQPIGKGDSPMAEIPRNEIRRRRVPISWVQPAIAGSRARGRKGQSPKVPSVSLQPSSAPLTSSRKRR